MLRFWLDRGVDGFRIDVAHGMVKAPGLPDWDGHVSMIEGSDDVEPTDTVSGAGNQGPMFDQDGVHDIYRAWNKVLAEYPGDRALVAEAWVEPLSRLSRYVRPDEMHQAFNFAFLATHWDAPALRTVVEASYRASDAVGAPTTWVLSNHDVVRHASRLGLAEPGSRPNGIGHGDEQPDEALGLRARALRVAADARPARLGVPVPGRGARPARPHLARRRPAPGPGVLPDRRRGARSRRLPRAAALGRRPRRASASRRPA